MFRGRRLSQYMVGWYSKVLDPYDRNEISAKEKAEISKQDMKYPTILHYIAGGIQALSALVMILLVQINAFGILDESNDGKISYGTQVWAHQEGVKTYPAVVKYVLLILIPAVTAAFHLSQASPLSFKDYQNGLNRIRWLEYCITASLMTFLIANLSGLVNFWLLLVVAIIGNIALQSTGYMFERANRPKLVRYFGEKVEKGHEEHKTGFLWLREDFVENEKEVFWGWFIAGCFIFVAQWAVITTAFVVAVSKAGSDNVPWFVWSIFFSMFFFFLSFALVMLFRALAVKVCTIDFYEVSTYETAYIVLSLTSKLSLDWIVFIGIASAA